jgi:hypothetical protein
MFQYRNHHLQMPTTVPNCPLVGLLASHFSQACKQILLKHAVVANYLQLCECAKLPGLKHTQGVLHKARATRPWPMAQALRALRAYGSTLPTPGGATVGRPTTSLGPVTAAESCPHRCVDCSTPLAPNMAWWRCRVRVTGSVMPSSRAETPQGCDDQKALRWGQYPHPPSTTASGTHCWERRGGSPGQHMLTLLRPDGPLALEACNDPKLQHTQDTRINGVWTTSHSESGDRAVMPDCLDTPPQHTHTPHGSGGTGKSAPVGRAVGLHSNHPPTVTAGQQLNKQRLILKAAKVPGLKHTQDTPSGRAFKLGGGCQEVRLDSPPHHHKIRGMIPLMPPYRQITPIPGTAVTPQLQRSISLSAHLTRR